MDHHLDAKKLKSLGKFVSLVLRHDPHLAGLELEPGGWVSVDRLLEGLRAAGRPITQEELDFLVQENDKRRYSYDASGTRIRANQGHSVPVDLGLEAASPPDVLYHGTHLGVLQAVLEQGLSKMERHAVHLSADAATAKTVGSRRGSPVVLRVDAKAMVEQGFVFHRSDNGVWLTERVPPGFLERL